MFLIHFSCHLWELLPAFKSISAHEAIGEGSRSTSSGFMLTSLSYISCRNPLGRPLPLESLCPRGERATLPLVHSGN